MSKMTNLKAFHLACQHIRSFISNFADVKKLMITYQIYCLQNSFNLH